MHARAAVARAMDTWGRLDVVVANAGIAGNVAMGETGGADRARDIFDTNLFGTYLVFDAALAVIRGPGRLVAISSVLGKFGVAGQAAYCASKAGLHGLVRAVAAEVGARGITCNAVCPGWVDTAMARARFAELAADSKTTYEAAREEAARGTPVGRFVEPEEVAELVAFLCSASGGADHRTGALRLRGHDAVRGVRAFRGDRNRDRSLLPIRGRGGRGASRRAGGLDPERGCSRTFK